MTPQPVRRTCSASPGLGTTCAPRTQDGLCHRKSMASDPIGELATDIDALLAFFERVDEQHWARWARAVRTDIANSDAHCLSRILGAYGGTGSFNDLAIHPINGHAVNPDDVANANQQLDSLRTRIHQTACDLHHQLRE